MQILYEDNHIIAINKDAGEIVQGDKTGDICVVDNLKNFIKRRDNKSGNVYMGLPHRLDRPTSGVLLLAKTDKALSRINDAIQKREFHKTYWAIVKDVPPKNEDTLENYLLKNEKQNKSYVVSQDNKNANLAKLHYKVIAKSDLYYLLEIKLFTGRHHQIRVQLANIGCPIKGDLKYGFSHSNKDASISLHARKLSLIHPVKKEEIEITAPVPNDKLWQILENLIPKI
jgi:23S rRNA pseudouridine1911/1915/1917 synthase